MKNKRKGFINPALLICIVFIVIVVGIFAFRSYKVTSSTPSLSSSSTSLVTNEDRVSSPSKPIPSGWNLFSSSTIPISFIYPSEWGNAVSRYSPKDEYGYGGDYSIDFVTPYVTMYTHLQQDFEDVPMALDTRAYKDAGESKIRKPFVVQDRKGVIIYTPDLTMVEIESADYHHLVMRFPVEKVKEEVVDQIISSIQFKIVK